MDPADKKWGQVEELKLFNHLVSSYCIESRTEVNEQNGCKGAR